MKKMILHLKYYHYWVNMEENNKLLATLDMIIDTLLLSLCIHLERVIKLNEEKVMKIIIPIDINFNKSMMIISEIFLYIFYSRKDLIISTTILSG